MHFVRISLLLTANKARTKGALQGYFLPKPKILHVWSQPDALLT